MWWLKFKSGWQCLTMFKNGFSTLGYVNYYENTGILLKETDNVWNNDRCFFNKDKDDNLKSFIVWRDPYERLVSLYKDCANDKNNHGDLYYRYHITRNALIQNPFMLVNFYERQLDDNAMLEEHTCPQSVLLNNYDLNEFDNIVLIKDLPTFIDKELGFKNVPIINKTPDNIDISVFEEQKEKIKYICKADYEIINKYKDKIWKPNY